MTGHAATQSWLCLWPRDTVVVRDGRAFNAGAGDAASATAPGPSTVAGAIRAAYGDEPGEVRGPLAAVKDSSGRWYAFFPTPADIVRSEDGFVHRLEIAINGAPVISDLSHQHPAVRPLVGNGAACEGLVPSGFLNQYLSAESPLAPGSHLGPDLAYLHPLSGAFWTVEQRLGLARTDQRAAAEGFFYRAEHLRFVDTAGLLVQVDDPPSDCVTTRTVPLGGERRLVDVLDIDAVDLPAHPEAFPEGRVAVYLATPAIFPDGWFWAPEGAELVAAAVTGPQPFANASPRLGLFKTRVLRWAAPAGSVYYLRFTDPGKGEDWARRYHAQCLPGQALDTSGRDRLRSAGFGLAFMGRW